MVEQPTQEAYRTEFDYLQGEQERAAAFSELLGLFQDPPEELVGTLRSLHASARGGFILDQDKLAQLQMVAPELYQELIQFTSGS